MRLGQLSRKLSVRSADIVSFLAKNNVIIEDGTNTRVDDSLLELIFSHFAPGESLKMTTVEPAVEIISPVVSPLPEEVTIEMKVQSNAQEAPEVEEQNPEATIQNDERTEVIKAPKIELQGLKVLGKIELPEIRKKEKEAAAEGEHPNQNNGQKAKGKTQERRQSGSNRFENRPRKNPIALERERQAREEEEKKKQQAELEKHKRRENYFKKVKHSVPTKSVRLIDEPVSHISEEDMTEQPKTLWGKFMKWLTSY